MKKENMFRATCEYKILCDSAADNVRPFPTCADVTWGASKAVDRYGLVPAHRRAVLAAYGGRVKLSFTKLRPVRLHANLICEGVANAALEKCVSVSELDNQVSYEWSDMIMGWVHTYVALGCVGSFTV